MVNMFPIMNGQLCGKLKQWTYVGSSAGMLHACITAITECLFGNCSCISIYVYMGNGGLLSFLTACKMLRACNLAKIITKWNVKTMIHSLSICNLATLPVYILHSMWHPKAMEPWGYTQGLPWSTHNQRLQSWGYAPHSTRRRPPEGSSLQTHWYQIHK